jgi:ATP-dependent Clp protease ATP-binding subunit ClpA
MFERFTTGARQVVHDSQREARRLQHGFIGCEHLLLALTLESEVTRTLGDAGVHHQPLEVAIRRRVVTRELDAEALGGIGIDLAAVRERVESVFGAGALEAAAFALHRSGGRWRLDRQRAARRRSRRRRRPAGVGEPCTATGLRFTPRAKEALQQAVLLSRRGGSGDITAEHLASAVIGINAGMVPLLLAELEVDTPSLIEALRVLGAG